MGLAAQYAAVKTDKSNIAEDLAKEAADVATEGVDAQAFVKSLGAGTIFVNADGTADLVVPDASNPDGFSAKTYPVGT